MGLTVTEDTPADMLAGSMELLVQLPRDHYVHTQRVTVLRSTPMMDLLVQIATAHKLTASSYTLQAIGERGLVLPHHPNTPIGALDALQVKLLPKQGTCVPRKTKQTNQPFETTFRLQVHLPRNQLYVSRVSPKMNLGEILDEVCREKNLDRNKYELRHPANLEETLDLALSLQDYHLQEVTLYAKQTRTLGPTLSTQDIMALQRQEERRRQQTKQSVFGFMFKKSKESSLSTDSLGGRSVSPARSDETGRSASPLQPPARPQRKRRPAPKPPTDAVAQDTSGQDSGKDKMVINHSRNSSDSSGYHEASVLSDNPDSAARLPETLPRRSKAPGVSDAPRKLAHTSQSSKSLGNLAAASGTLTRGISSTSLSSTGLRKKRAAPPPPAPRPLSSAISTQALERIVDSEESLTSDMDPSKPPSDIGAPSKAGSDIDCSKANSDIGVSTQPAARQTLVMDYSDKPKAETSTRESDVDVVQRSAEARSRSSSIDRSKLARVDSREMVAPVVEAVPRVEQARVAAKRVVGEPAAPIPKPRKVNAHNSAAERPKPPKRKVVLSPLALLRTSERDNANEHASLEHIDDAPGCSSAGNARQSFTDENTPVVTQVEREETCRKSRDVRASLDEDRSSRSEELSENIDGTKVNIDSSSRQKPNHEIEFEPNLNIAIRAATEETHSKSKEEFTSKDETKLDERIPNVADDTEIGESTSNPSSSHDEITKHYELHSTPAGASSEQPLSLEITPEEKEADLSGQNHEGKRADVNSREESESSRADNPSQNAIRTDRELEKPPHRPSYPERPPRTPRKIHPTIDKTEESIRVANHATDTTTIDNAAKEIKGNPSKDRETCTIISAIPKCERLEAVKEDSQTNEYHRDTVERMEEDTRNVKRTRVFRSQSKSDDFEMNFSTKQRRYFTSPSTSIAYALNLNLPTQNSTSNTREKERESIDVEECAGRTVDGDVNKGESHSGLIVTAKEDTQSETAILLQKVSDTLSSTLPTSSSVDPPAPEYATVSARTRVTSDIKTETTGLQDESSKMYRSCVDFSADNTLNASTPNITAGSQQDTSDYVSAMGEDLSISDWEYQLPAPPSAFRDSHSPVLDDCDTVTLGSVEVFKESPVIHPNAKLNDATDSCERHVEITASNLLNNVDANLVRRAAREKTDFTVEMEIDEKQTVSKVRKQTSTASRKEANTDPRKEIISELENKIENGTLAQTIGKDFDRSRSVDSAPKIAPVDNTLSNFTITTYTKQRSLDIFDEFEEQPSGYSARSTDERFIKTFATLTRSNVDANNHESKNAARNTARLTNGVSSSLQNKREDSNASNTDRNKTEPKIHNRDETGSDRWQNISNATGEKTNVQRSKSYISMSSNAKYQTESQTANERKHEPRVERLLNAGMKKATSTTGLNVEPPKGNEKFSQWRDNILKRQEEPTKEKQLQSLQVLKSILPQLKNAQQAEENVSKEYNNALIIEKTNYEGSNEHSVKTNVVSTHDSRDTEAEFKQPPKEENMKRRTYTGPPAISLSSWSERPSGNVQIKMDTDYKLGKSNNASGGKTVVNINGAREEDANCRANGSAKREIKIDSNKNTDELSRKLITHTTASAFKKPLSNRMSTPADTMKVEDRPVVTGVELKKTFEVKEMSRNGENEIDTTPVNFRELAKTFGPHVNFKSKPKRANINRHSADCHGGVQLDETERIADASVVRQNGHAKFARPFNESDLSHKNQLLLANGVQQTARPKKFMSVVGVNGTNHQNGPQNEAILRSNMSNAKINPMPVVKGFKIAAADSKTSNGQVNQNGLSAIDGVNKVAQPPKPPTMPVITGVTLKSASARPKSMPVQTDPRDMLLESIRNFGGRGKLKSTAERY